MIIKLICQAKNCGREFEHIVLHSNQSAKKKYCDMCNRKRINARSKNRMMGKYIKKKDRR